MVLCALGLGLACGQGEDLLAPASGALRVSTLSTGVDLDADGYTIIVDQADGMPLGTNDVLELASVPPGDHAVALTEIADNCIVAGDNPRTVAIFDQETSNLDFRISCRAPLGLGTLVIQTTTSGVPTNSAGYSVVVDPVPAVAAALNGEVVVGDLTEGEHLVRLSDVPGACTVAGENPRTVSVPAADTARALFAVTCWPSATGRIAFARHNGGNSELNLIRGDGTGLVNLSQEYDGLGFSLSSAAEPSWSPDGGRLAVWSDGIILIDAQPDADTPPPTRLTGPGSACPSWSPDGETLLIVDQDSIQRLHSLNLGTGAQRTLFVDSDETSMDRNGCPAWSPDGRRIALAVTRSPLFAGDVLVIDADGGNPTSLLGGLPGRSVDGVAWGGDSSRLAFVADRSASTSFQDIFVVSLPSGSPVAVTGGRFPGPLELSFSPDGNRIVFSANSQLFVVNVDGSGLTQLTIPGIGNFDVEPAWGRDP